MSNWTEESLTRTIHFGRKNKAKNLNKKLICFKASGYVNTAIESFRRKTALIEAKFKVSNLVVLIRDVLLFIYFFNGK